MAQKWRARGDSRVEYLLAWRPEHDKSRFLALAGYTVRHARRLKRDIRTQLLPLAAILDKRTAYGDMYRIRGTLAGPNGRSLSVVSIWMRESATGITKFITLFPDKES